MEMCSLPAALCLCRFPPIRCRPRRAERGAELCTMQRSLGGGLVNLMLFRAVLLCAGAAP